jgi:hypothetical protein
MTARASFADMAVELRLLCLRETAGLELLEVQAAGNKVIASVLPDLRASVVRAAAAADLMKALIPFEPTILALLAVGPAHVVAPPARPDREASGPQRSLHPNSVPLHSGALS